MILWFDTRFATSHIDNQVRNAISNATGVKGVTFETITDYLVLIVYQLKLLGITKTELRKLTADFVDAEERLRTAIPISVFNQIIHTDNNAKIAALKKYIWERGFCLHFMAVSTILIMWIAVCFFGAHLGEPDASGSLFVYCEKWKKYPRKSNELNTFCRDDVFTREYYDE